eukprot:gene32113-38835_t
MLSVVPASRCRIFFEDFPFDQLALPCPTCTFFGTQCLGNDHPRRLSEQPQHIFVVTPSLGKASVKEFDELATAACPRAPEQPTAKAPRLLIDQSETTANRICVPFRPEILSGDVANILESLKVPLLTSIPVDEGFFPRMYTTPGNSTFAVVDGEEAVTFTEHFKAFHLRCKQLSENFTEESVLCAITSITGGLWKELALLIQLQPLLTFKYSARDVSGATQDGARPDEIVHLNDFLVAKGEHKKSASDLRVAVAEQTKKLASYNHVEYGTMIVYLPVYSAAGSLVEFGVVDVRNKRYFCAIRHSVEDPLGRLKCFVSAINMFRLILTMAPFIPNNPSPLFKDQLDGALRFFDSYIIKKVKRTDTCPADLYNILATGSVPFAAKVVYNSSKISLRISPVGVRTPDRGEGLSIDEVRVGVRCCLECLAYLHAHQFVHRDIRWANMIRVYNSRPDGSIVDVKFRVIDFEFSGRSGEPMNIDDYIFADVVPFGQPYTPSHDIYFVGMLVQTWAEVNRTDLDESAAQFVHDLQHGELDADAALRHRWLL